MAVGRRIEGPDDPSQEGRLGSHRACRPSRADRPPRRVPVESITARTRPNPSDGPADRRWDRRSRNERRHGDRDGRGCTDQSNRIARRQPRLTGQRIRQNELSCPRGTPDPMKMTRRMHVPSAGRSHPRAARPPRHGRRPPYSTVLRHHKLVWTMWTMWTMELPSGRLDRHFQRNPARSGWQGGQRWEGSHGPDAQRWGGGSDKTNPARSGWQGSHRLKPSYQRRDRRWGARIQRNEPRTIGVAGITPIGGAWSHCREGSS